MDLQQLQQLQRYLGLENNDRRFGFLIAQPFMANIMQVPFDDWKETFIGAFLHKYADRPQVLRMMCDALGVQYVSWKHLTRAVSYTHLTLPTTARRCRSRWSPYH